MSIKILRDTGEDGLVLEVAPLDIELGDVLVGGYEVIDIAPAEHQNKIARRFALADDDGAREVGRLVLRVDGIRGARLVVTRWFESPVEVEEFRAKIEADLPPAAHQVLARTLERGQSLLLDGEAWEIESVTLGANWTGRIEVTIALKGRAPAVYTPDDRVWVE